MLEEADASTDRTLQYRQYADRCLLRRFLDVESPYLSSDLQNLPFVTRAES